MSQWIRRPSWRLPERDATPEHVFLNRRAFIQSTAAAALFGGCQRSADADDATAAAVRPATTAPAGLYPAPRNRAFTLDRPLTEEREAATYTNFYEFGTSKSAPWRNVDRFVAAPWQIEIAGEARKTGVFDIEDLIGDIPLEERLYRLCCVEAWAIAVPWTGFEMRRLIEKLKPTTHAKFVRLVTFHRPEQAPGQRSVDWLDWPYQEALSLAEATNELTLLVTGIYGHPLPKQHGAPIRLIVPWKYGFKSIKSIVKIEFTRTRPPTTWNTAVPHEYDFIANVDPGVPHPRWSQATERMLGTDDVRPTVKYNGYGEYVAGLYA
ncbi:MAG: protein-methionine-sulfoxide reductase catalytic subunit MsrP [Phycisphaerae bacterium]